MPHGIRRSIAIIADDRRPLDVRPDVSIGYHVHEMRNLIGTAITAFEVLGTANGAAASRASRVLQRTLSGLSALVNQSVLDVRLERGIQNAEVVSVGACIDEIAEASVLEATARGLRFSVGPRVGQDVAVKADRQVFAAIVTNLIQNAFKYTRPHTTVTLGVVARTDRVRIEVRDECGGFAVGQDPSGGLIAPQGSDRSGLGLGLAFCRRGVEALEGELACRSTPGQGCAFTFDLSRLPVLSASPPASRSLELR
jgi:signal transduction histidine kinase